MPSIAVTGCSSGFGKVTVHRFLDRGWRVVATVRKDADRDALVEAARASGAADRLTVVRADITQAADVAQLGEAVAARGPALDALVNNAGTAYPAPLEVLPIEHLRAQLEINVVAQLAVTQAVLPALKAARGVIINVSSISGRIAAPTIGAYSASKFALEALSDVLRLELAPFGVRVAVIEPGSSPTNIWDTSVGRAEAHGLERTIYAPLTAAMRARADRERAAGFPPELFAETVWKIVSSASPRTRYPIPGQIRRLVFVRRLISDKFLDRQMRRLLKW